MQIDTLVYVVWAHRDARSLFGPASNPVMQNGGFLCFNTEERAQSESDELNARSGATHVRYSVKPVPVLLNRPDAVAKIGSAAPHFAMPRVALPLPGLAATRLA